MSAVLASSPAMLMAGLDWQRPLALVLLLLPILVVLLSRIWARPEPEATGTLEIWRRAEHAAPRTGSRARTRIPPSIVMLALALVLAVLALAGPRFGVSEDKRCLVVVDRSPSMYVGGRLQRALSAARGLLARAGVDSVEWIAPPSTERASGPEAPASWLVAPRVPRGEPDFAAHDERATLWVTDRAPSSAPRHAGFVAAGGPAVPGPVGVHAGHLLEWDGTSLHDARAVLPEPVRLVGNVPDPIARVFGAWAAARGHVVDSNALAVGCALELRGVGGAGASSEGRTVEFGRDGWSSRGRAAPLSLENSDTTLERWLADASGESTLVATGAGRVTLGLVACDQPGGDPAAFAVSWSRLFDTCALLPPDCVSLSERADAGSALEREPQFDDPDSTRAPNSLPALLALAATACGLVALALVARSPFGALLGTDLRDRRP